MASIFTIFQNLFVYLLLLQKIHYPSQIKHRWHFRNKRNRCRLKKFNRGFFSFFMAFFSCCCLTNCKVKILAFVNIWSYWYLFHIKRIVYSAIELDSHCTDATFLRRIESRYITGLDDFQPHFGVFSSIDYSLLI